MTAIPLSQLQGNPDAKAKEEGESQEIQQESPFKNARCLSSEREAGSDQRKDRYRD
ncbi:MAG: hypothetical protein KF807_00140 [Xanthobacteraceae bacterium]|nr:hypothetical protein [Xanthobacteraceae bacterium]